MECSELHSRKRSETQRVMQDSLGIAPTEVAHCLSFRAQSQTDRWKE